MTHAPATATPQPESPTPAPSAEPTPAQSTLTLKTAFLSAIDEDVSFTTGAGNATPVTAETLVPSGSTIVVGPAGLAQLRLHDGTVLRLGRLTTATFQIAADDSLDVDVTGSLLWLTAPVSSTAPTRFSLDGTAVTSAGSNVYAGCDSDACFVGVVDGSASVTAASGATADLAAYQVTFLAGDSEAGQVVTFPPSAITVDSFANQNSMLNHEQQLRIAPTNAGFATLDGSFDVTYETIASDRDDLTGETVTRQAQITTECIASLSCQTTLSLEIKGPTGDTITLDTPLIFDDGTYHGQVTGSDPCYNRISGAGQEGANQDYTGIIEINVLTASDHDGQFLVDTYESTNVDTTVINEAGRALNCSVNLRNDGFSATSTTTGAAVRQ